MLGTSSGGSVKFWTQMTTSTIAVNTQTQINKLYMGHCVWLTKSCSCEEKPWKARLCIRDQSLLQADAVVVLRPASCLVAFLVLKWQALGACDEFYILVEENNFTDLTFGEKENSEQGPTVCTKQASYTSSFECASVIFPNTLASPCWIGLQLKANFDQNPFLWERGVFPYAHICPLCVMLCSFKFPAHSAW